jgi:DNA-binding NtrC family response regulator
MADILVVDDDEDLAAALTDVLVDVGHTVRVADNGWAGLAALDERLPDLVLLDIEMPSLDGPGMAAEMFVHDAGRERIPILLVSAFADLPAVARRIGTPYSAPKPCELGKLLGLVDRALLERIPPTFPPALRANQSTVGAS